MVLCDPPARLAKDPVREDLVLQPLKTRVVIRELLLKRLEVISAQHGYYYNLLLRYINIPTVTLFHYSVLSYVE